MVHKIKHNDLMPWFLEDHGTLPKAYLESCKKFFDELQAASHKQQATSLPQSGDTVIKNRKEEDGKKK